MPSISPRYAAVLSHVTKAPRTADEIYRLWADVPEGKPLRRRARAERRWVAGVLVHLSTQKVISREIVTTPDHKQWVCFWRPSLDAHAPGHDQSRGRRSDATGRD